MNKIDTKVKTSLTLLAFTVAGTCMVGASPVKAEQAQAHEREDASAVSHYNMKSTISAAINASADLAIAKRNIEIDKKRSDEAKAAGRPNITASGTATRFDQPTKESFGAAKFTVIGNHTETLALSLNERLDLTGQIRAASSQAQLQSLADQFIYLQAQNQRILRARTVYYNLLRAKHQVQVAEQALETARAQQSLAVKLNTEQVGQKIDVLRANTQVANATQDLTRARNALGIAQQNFNDLVGSPLNTPIDVDDVPGVTFGESITNATSVNGEAPGIAFYTMPKNDIDSINVDKSIDFAQTHRPELLMAEVNTRIAQTGIKIARAGLEPVLGLNATGDYYPTTSFQTPRQRVGMITATLSIPLYDGGATRDRVAEARLRKSNADTTLDSIKSNVSLDIRNAYLNMITAANQIDAANTALQQAIATRQLAQIRYEGQVGLYLEVTDAQTALVAAENNQVNAVYDYLIARAQYNNAIGSPEVE